MREHGHDGMGRRFHRCVMSGWDQGRQSHCRRVSLLPFPLVLL